MSELENIADQSSDEDNAYFAEDSANEEKVTEAVEEEIKHKEESATEEDELTTSDEDKAKAEKAKQTMVPHGALHEERKKRQAAEQRQAQMEQAWQANVQQQAMAYARQMVEEQQRQAQLPTFEDDPAGYLRYQQEQLSQQNQQHQQWMQQQAQQQQIQQQNQQFLGSYKQQADAYRAQNPDFGAAYNHLFSDRVAELTDLGYGQEEAVALTHQEEANIVAKAMQDGVNPAERIFNLSKRRGFKPATQAATEEVKNPFETVKRGQEASKSLSNGGGGSAKGVPTLASLLNMEDGDFDANFKKTMGG